MKRDQQTVNEERNCCCNILKLWLDLVACTKSVFTLVSVALKENSKGAFIVAITPDVGLFVFFLANFIYSVVRFAVKQEPLGYNITCTTISFISLFVSSCRLVYTLLSHSKARQKSNKIMPEDGKENKKPTVMKLEDIEDDVQNQGTGDNPAQQLSDKLDPVGINKQLAIAFKLLHEFFLYPAIICSLYGLINEKQWQFDDAFAGYSFLFFLYSVFMDALYTKLKYIWVVQKFILSLSLDAEGTCKMVLIKCTLPCLSIMPHIFLLALIHWLMIAIIGVRIYVDNFSREINETRIYVDNFSREIDQVNASDTGDYEVASWTGYMIFCGFYLPVASVIVYFVLHRAWFIDEMESKCKKIFFFLYDPVAYIAVPFLMVPFIAFCVGMYLPDYDSSEFEVDPNARTIAAGLGFILIIIFLFCNIRAVVILGITVILLPIVIANIFMIVAIALVIIGLIVAIVIAIISIMVVAIICAVIVMAFCAFCACCCGLICLDSGGDGDDDDDDD